MRGGTPLVVLLLAALVAGSGLAQTTENRPSDSSLRIEKRVLEKVVSHHARIQYLLALPKGYAENSDLYPLIVYLHGGSARGSDIDQMKHLGLTKKAEMDPNFPFIVVSPQCSQGEIWTDMDGLAAVLDEVIATCRVDADRVYVAGHSMGAGALCTRLTKCLGVLPRYCHWDRFFRSQHGPRNSRGFRSG